MPLRGLRSDRLAPLERGRAGGQVFATCASLFLDQIEAHHPAKHVDANGQIVGAKRANGQIVGDKNVDANGQIVGAKHLGANGQIGGDKNVRVKAPDLADLRGRGSTEGVAHPLGRLGGAKGTRTPNPLLAKQVRYQLRHGPEVVRCARPVGFQFAAAAGTSPGPAATSSVASAHRSRSAS